MNKNEFWRSKEGLAKISKWQSEGLNQLQLAERIGVATRTLRKWIQEYPEIDMAMRRGESTDDDALIEDAMLRRAIGFTTVEVKRVKKPNGAEEITRVKKQIPPDMAAVSMWLKNRRPDRWGDKRPGDLSEAFGKMDEILEGLNAQADR